MNATMTLPRLATRNAYSAKAAEMPPCRVPYKPSGIRQWRPDYWRRHYRKWPPPDLESRGRRPFDGLADRTVSKECPTSRIRLSQSCSPARLEESVCKQIATIPALVKDAVVRLFDDAGLATESSPDTKVMSVIQTVVN